MSLLRLGVPLVFGSLAALALILAAVASAETVIVRNNGSYVGAVINVQCPSYNGQLTVVSGEELQMSRSHYDKNGNLVWYSEHQTHAALKALSDSGETFVLQEVDNIRYTNEFTSQDWIGHEFYVATGPADGAIENWRFAFVSRIENGELIFDHVVTTCESP
jgi:hypothetical protein